MSTLDQWAALTRLGLDAARARAAAHTSTLIGTAGVVALVAAVLAASAGFRQTLQAGVDPETAIVLRNGATSELLSVLRGEEARLIESRPEWRGGGRARAVSSELFLVVALEPAGEGADAAVTLRGVGEGAYRVRNRFSIVAGRRFAPGRNELMVGVRAQRRFGGLELGDHVSVAGQRWPVVGVFQTGGREDSELWGDAAVLQGLYRRGDTIQAVYAKPVDAEALARVRNQFEQDPRLEVDVHLQSDYYARQADTVARVVDGFALLLSVVVGAAAAFAALDTMYASVDERKREIATLRAFGFSRMAILMSITSESLSIALVGGAAGCVLAYLGFDGFNATTLDFRGFSRVAFAFAVTPQVLGQGMAIATLLGLTGGLLPALRACRAPIAMGLRR